MSLMDDWRAHQTGEAAFNSFHFEFLLKSHHEPAELEQIFADLPQADQAIERLQGLFEFTRRGGFDYQLPKSSKIIEPEHATELARLIRDETIAFLLSIAEEDLAEELQDLPIVEATTDQLKAAGNDLNNLQFGIGDAIGDTYLGQPYDPPHVHAVLYEAVLSLTKYSELARYILDPIWPFELKHDADMRLYLGGYTHFARNTEILLVKL